MSTCTFKPKGMSYTEFLRSKKSTAVKVINTKKLQDASDITTQRRLGASQVFALNNDEVKGVINHPPDFSQEPLNQLQSSYKTGGSGRKPGDASDFTAYTGGQAIGKQIQAGVPTGKLVQTPDISLTSPAVPQSASDFTRRTQGCKESLGEPHQATTVTPPVFVDDTIRNLGNPTLCTTGSVTRAGGCANSITSRPANHSIKAETAFPKVPNRPSQAGGQYALKGDREPGKEAGAFGGVTIAHVKSNIPVKSIRTRSGINVNYKVGAALDNIPYVENHHGNDLGVNPKQPFVKYQIPGGVTPAHLKINKPISTLCCPTGRPGPPPSPPVLEDPDLSGYSFINSASITVNETGGTTYQWWFSNDAGDVPLTNGAYSEATFDITVSGATTSTLDINIDAYVLPGTPSFNVYCVVTNEYGTVTTNPATITYIEPPVLGDPDLSGYSFTNSASITVNETGGTTYQWYFSNEFGDVPLRNDNYQEGAFFLSVSGVTTSTLDINIDYISDPMGGSFSVYCVVSTGGGAVTTGTATITYAP